MQLLRVLRAHIGLILLTVSIAWLSAIALTEATTPTYSATSSVLVDSADNAFGAAAPTPMQPYSSFLATQIDLIASQTVALKVVERLRLEEDDRARDRFLGTPSRLQSTLERLKSTLRSATAWMTDGENREAAQSDLAGGAAGRDLPLDRFRLADQILKKTSVRPSPDSNVIQVSYAAPTPSAAAQAANTIVESFMDTALELNVNPARASSEWLDTQVERLEAEAREARAKLTEFQQRAGIVSADDGNSDQSARLADLNAQLVAAQSQNHPAILALKSDLARAQAKLNELPPQLGPNHPAYRSAQDEVAMLRAQLNQESAQLAETLRREIANQRGSMLGMKRQHAQLAALQDAVDSAQRALDDASQKSMQARMNSSMTQTNLSVVRVAVPPRSPTSPNPLFNFALATVLGLALGVGLALWREVVCRFVRGADDLRDFLGIQVLGVLHGGPRSASGRARLPNRPTPLLSVDRTI